MLSNKAQHSLRMKQLLQWRWRADFPITLFSTAPVTSISSKRLNSSSSLKIKELLQESQSKNEVKIQVRKVEELSTSFIFFSYVRAGFVKPNAMERCYS
jgi:hypothetical protein